MNGFRHLILGNPYEERDLAAGYYHGFFKDFSTFLSIEMLALVVIGGLGSLAAQVWTQDKHSIYVGKKAVEEPSETSSVYVAVLPEGYGNINDQPPRWVPGIHSA